MRGTVRLEVQRRAGRSALTRCAATTPVAARPLTRAPPGFAAVALVQSVGGPLGGDEASIEVDVGAEAALEVRTLAATLVLGGPGEARQHARIRLGPGARLLWDAEPVVVTRGARFRATLEIELAEGAVAFVRETWVRGRHDEPGGELEATLRADLTGQPLLRDATRFAPGEPAVDSAAVLGGARTCGTLALLGRRAPVADLDACDLAGEGTLLRAVAAGTAALDRRLADPQRALRAALGESAALAGEPVAITSNQSSQTLSRRSVPLCDSPP